MKNTHSWKCQHCDAAPFRTRADLFAHIHERHPEHTRPHREYEWKCKYCGEIFSSRRKLLSHFLECVEKAKQPIDSKGRTIDRDAQERSAATIRRKFDTGELKRKSYPHTPEWRVKMAEIMRKKAGIMDAQCNFNERACQYIDQLNETRGWNLQHAMNGGEVRVGPYSLDGYDAERNIAFEYDENGSRHNSKRGRERDLYRQRYIIEQIGCEFWRYSEREDRLYRVIEEK